KGSGTLKKSFRPLFRRSGGVLAEVYATNSLHAAPSASCPWYARHKELALPVPKLIRAPRAKSGATERRRNRYPVRLSQRRTSASRPRSSVFDPAVHKREH